MTRIPFAERFPALLASLQAAYAEPHRAYHNWVHIEALLAHYDRVQSQIAGPEAFELAIYYHDVVYAPLSRTNEQDSARRMTDEVAGAVEPTVLSDAVALVQATEKHQVPSHIAPLLVADCELFLDMDLAILGSAPNDFGRYERAIREEYAIVPDDLYNNGRRAILEGFDARSAIYFPDAFRKSHESRARENLSLAISRL